MPTKPIQIFSRNFDDQATQHTIQFDLIGRRVRIVYLYDGMNFKLYSHNVPLADFDLGFILNLPYGKTSCLFYIEDWHKKRFRGATIAPIQVDEASKNHKI